MSLTFNQKLEVVMLRVEGMVRAQKDGKPGLLYQFTML